MKSDADINLELRAEIVQFKEQLDLNSKNSSKLLSSEKPFKSGIKPLKSARKRGGQPGHFRKLQEQSDKVIPFLWHFVEAEESTANAAELALRAVVVSRKVQYDSQSERGSRFQECIQTVIATCRQQGRNALAFCQAALKSHFGLGNTPSLLPQICPSKWIQINFLKPLCQKK